MRQLKWKIATLNGVSLAVAMLISPALWGQEPKTQTKTVEPVFRVSKLTSIAPNENPDAANNDVDKRSATKEMAKANAKAAAAGIEAPGQPHSLDKALRIAKDGLSHMRENIHDYTALLVKRERVNGQLNDPTYMNIKVRNERDLDGSRVPFSVYIKFLKPKGTSGREVIWVQGENEGKLAAHEGSLNFRTFWLDPTGWLAMKGQKYPIYDAGLEKLIVKLIEKAERDRAAGPCKVEYREGCKINNRCCTMIQLTHSVKKSPYEFHKAQVFVDDELQIPVRYAAYDWPTTDGEKPPLIEEYTYVRVKINVGLKEIDFDVNNPAYKFPK